MWRTIVSCFAGFVKSMATKILGPLSDPASSQCPQEKLSDTTSSTTSIDTFTTKISTLLSNFLYDKELEPMVYVPRFKQRLSILKAWSISPGKQVLDIGCGQGESCITLALELGPSSHITGIDTARPDYGIPYTVSQAHAKVASSPLGEQINFLQTDAETLMKSLNRQLGTVFDAVTLCHSLWYFPTKDSVYELFVTLAEAGISKIYLAEYNFQASISSQIPHVLAAKAQALFHSFKVPREPGTRTLNVRAAPDVKTVLDAAHQAGFGVGRQGTFTPEPDMLEGHFEARYVTKEVFAERVRVEGFPKEQEDEVLAYQPLVEKAMAEMRESGIEKVRAMDTWWAELVLKK